MDPTLVQDVAGYLGALKAYEAAGLTPAQAALVDQAKPVPVQALQPSSGATTKATSVIGLVLLFLMLTQYNTWILIGVMQEKSSRVVEVLLAAVRPIQLLGGKVLGIGLVALGQATLIVGFALIVGAAVGSDLLRGTAPLVLACELLWLVLGYAFYCWVYAAAGSTAERQDQVQTLALPLSIPILLGYIFSITVASTGNPRRVIQDPRLPATDGPVLHVCACGTGPGHLVGVRCLGADHDRRDCRSGHLRRPHLPSSRAPDGWAGQGPRAPRAWRQLEVSGVRTRRQLSRPSPVLFGPGTGQACGISSTHTASQWELRPSSRCLLARTVGADAFALAVSTPRCA